MARVNVIFLRMLINDIERMCYTNAGTNMQKRKITRADIESLSSYRIMNDDERKIVDSILAGMNKKHEEGGIELSKRIDTIVPRSEYQKDEYNTLDYKDAA